MVVEVPSTFSRRDPVVHVGSLTLAAAGGGVEQSWIWVAKLDDASCVSVVAGRVGSGVTAFGRLSAEKQTRVLGPAAAAAFRAGGLSLSDLVAERTHPVWGPSVVRVSNRTLGL